MGDKYNPYDNLSKHWKVNVAETEAKKKLKEEVTLSDDFKGLTRSERTAICEWAMKTSRTEELTGQQVVRILGLMDLAVTDAKSGLPVPAEVLLQANDEFRHAILYAQFAQAASPIDAKEIAKRGNFSTSKFTSIFRVMDGLPVIYGGEPFVHFMVGLFFLDLAGLMTVNVYEESPFRALQQIAISIKADEGRHVSMGREYLLRVRDGKLLASDGRTVDGERVVRDAVTTMFSYIDDFFGNDTSGLQQTLRKVGIKNTPNSELKQAFRKKVNALLRLD